MPATAEAQTLCAMPSDKVDHLKTETLDFLQIISQFEETIKDDYKYELLETHYLPYFFGSGTTVYRLSGHNLKINLDGRDGLIEIQLSPKHEKYPTDEWIIIFSGTPSVLFENGIELIKSNLAD